MYGISATTTPVTIPSISAATSTFQLSADDRITALEQEIFQLRNKRVFDGVEIIQQRKPNNQASSTMKLLPNNPQPSELSTSTPPPVPIEQPEPDNSLPSTSMQPSHSEKPIVHCYAKTREANYLPPHERNYATSAPKPPKEKDFAYQTHAPVQDSKIADKVYTRSMKTSFVTLLHQELLLLSPEVRQKVREAVTPKCVVPDTKETHINTIDDSLPFANEDTPSILIADTHNPPPGSLIIQDPYEQYLSSLRPREHPDHNQLTIAKELHAL